MTININELRRLAQAATPGVGHACTYHNAHWLREGHVDFENADLFIASERPQEDAAFYAAANPAAISELLDRLEAAEKEIESWKGVAKQFGNDADALRTHLSFAKDELNRLRTKIAEMEKQEPVAKVRVHRTGGNAGIAWSVAPLNDFDSLPLMRDGDRLYALPGAQPGQRASDVWLPVPEKHPTYDPVDLQLSDGSVLCGCVPQADGDYWWKGPSGEVFIDPRYASVTHWRLAADQEAKP